MQYLKKEINYDIFGVEIGDYHEFWVVSLGNDGDSSMTEIKIAKKGFFIYFIFNLKIKTLLAMMGGIDNSSLMMIVQQQKSKMLAMYNFLILELKN